MSSRYLTQWFILYTALFVSIVFQKHLFLGKIGLLFLALLSGINFEYALYAIFFYSAFFHSSGMIPNLFFTLKHFHIAVVLLTVILAFRSELWGKIREHHRSALFLLIPWGLILLISTVAILIVKDADSMAKGLRMNANILTLVLSAFLLICTVEKRQVIMNGLFAFAFGVGLRVILAITSLITTSGFYYTEGIMNNNHIGFLSASSIFILFASSLVSKPQLKKIQYLISGTFLLLIFTGLLLSCSRTGWLSFVTTCAVFAHSFSRLRTSQATREGIASRLVLIGMMFSLAIVVMAGVFLNEDIYTRVVAFKRFFDVEYWRYTFQDMQNFGAFGFFRLRQIFSIQQVLKEHWLFGVGFIREITDYHSLYLTVLGGSGILGFLLFFLCISKWIREVIADLEKEDDGFNLLRLGVFGAFLVWLIYSLMETFIVQFNIWLVIALGIVLSDKKRWEKKSDGLYGKVSHEDTES